MTNKILSIVAILLSGSVFVGFFWGGAVSQGFGAAGTLLAENYIPYVMYNDGYASENGITLIGADGDLVVGDDATIADDLTVSGGSLSVPTSNAATSTISGGCIQTTATSTATPIRLVPASSGATTTYTGANAFGVMAWQFGTCPI